MKTGREFLNEHIEETNIPAEHWEVEIGEMMEWYAEYYHQAKLKLLGIANVVGRNEQLPQPDCHFYDEEHKKWIWAYSKELIDSLR